MAAVVAVLAVAVRLLLSLFGEPATSKTPGYKNIATSGGLAAKASGWHDGVVP